MPSSYPGGLDSFSTSRADNTPQASTHATEHNNTNDALNKIEAELGTTPKGTDATVAARLARIDASVPLAKLSSPSAVGDDHVNIAGAMPTEFVAGAPIAIGAFTTSCEVSTIASVSGNTVTLNDKATVTGTTISFTSGTKAIANTTAFTRIFVGDKIIVSGSASNNSTFTVTAISSDLKTLTVSESVVTEAAGANVTIRVRLNKTHSTGDRVAWLQGGLIPAEVYGIKSTSSTGDASNNTTQMQRASNEFMQTAGFSGLYLPRGVTYINNTVFLDSGFCLFGSGVDTSIIRATGMTFPDNDTSMLKTRNGTVATFSTPPGGPMSRLYMDGILIDGNNISGANGLLGTFQQPAAWGNVRFINCPGYGLCITQTQDFRVYGRLEFTACGIALRYRGVEFAYVGSLNIEQSVTSDFLAEDNGFACVHNSFRDVHLESSLGAGAKYFDIRSGDGWLFENVFHSNPDNTGTLFNFDSALSAKITYTLEDVRCNQPSTSFKVINDVQRSESLTVTAVNRIIQRLESGVGTARWAYLACGNASGGTSGPPEFPGGLKTSVVTSGALPSSSLTSGTATQLSTTRDVNYMFVVVLNPTAANTATALVELSPDNVTYTQVGKQEMPAGSGITTGSFLHTFTVYVPAGWYIKCTMTNGSIGGSFGRFW